VTAESVDRVVVQLVDVMSAHSTDAEEASNDGTLLGRHSVRLLVVEMSCRMAATAHPKFVDECEYPPSARDSSVAIQASIFTPPLHATVTRALESCNNSVWTGAM